MQRPPPDAEIMLMILSFLVCVRVRSLQDMFVLRKGGFSSSFRLCEQIGVLVYPRKEKVPTFKREEGRGKTTTPLFSSS